MKSLLFFSLAACLTGYTFRQANAQAVPAGNAPAAVSGNAQAAPEAGSTLSGAIRDGESKPVPMATVYLNRAQDSVLVKTAIADEVGKFAFAGIGEGAYLLTVTCVGFKGYTSAPVAVTGQAGPVAVPDITLAAGETELKEVVVVGRKPFIEQQIDRTVVNVGAMIGNAGANALEVLEKSPGVMVDGAGNLNLRGKPGVLVIVDGKQTYLSGKDLYVYLQSLNASQLDKIEIMTNPPARYSAEGSGGIINIVTRKEKQQGMNGNFNVSYGQGYYEKMNASLNINFRKKKVNVYGNLGYNNTLDYERVYRNRNYRGGGQTGDLLLSQYSDIKYIRLGGNAKLGLDYYANRKTTFGVILNGFYNPTRDLGINKSVLYNSSNLLDSTVYARNNTDNEWRNGNVNLNMVHRFDSTGKELSVDLDFADYKSLSSQTFDTYVYVPDGPTAVQSPREYLFGENQTSRNTLTGELPRDIAIYSLNADYTTPLRGGVRLETGFKSSLVKTRNAANYYNPVDGVLLPNYDLSNTFYYDENINATYLSAHKDFKRLGVKAGLRAEHTYAKGVQTDNPTRADSVFNRNYVSLFPTLFVSYKLDSADKHQLRANLGRRINRPSYNMLNPFLSFIDKFYQDAGNPFLKPQFIVASELSYSFKNLVTVSAFTEQQTNTFNFIVEPEGKKFTNRPGNVGNIGTTGAWFLFDLRPVEWWSSSIFAEVGNKTIRSAFNGVKVDTNLVYYNLNVMNRLTFGKGWSGEVFGFWSSRQFTGQYAVRPLGELNLGIRKAFANEKGSVSLGAKDIFFTRVSRGDILNIPQVDAQFDNRRDSRVVTLSLEYRFGSNANRQSRQGKEAADAEKRRVNN